MRSENWSGLITNASPHALPPGAAVEQVNFHNAIPGQLTSRGGMRRVSHLDDRIGIVDCFAVQGDGVVFLLALGDDGLHALESPSYGPETLPPYTPTPDSEGGVVETTYLWHYEGYGQSVVGPGDDDADGDQFVLVIDGGVSGSSGYSLYINANQQCQDEGAVSSIDGGKASTATFPPVLRETQLCELQ